MKILGIGGSDHNLSACLCIDGNIQAAIEEERLSYEKHGNGVRSSDLKCVDYCLKAADVGMDEIDFIVTNDLLQTRINSRKSYYSQMLKINHHMSHAAGCYYMSGFDDAAWLIADGTGSQYSLDVRETVTTGIAEGTTFQVVDKVYGEKVKLLGGYADKNSLGVFYNCITRLCGFGNFGDGKLMGLAPYGSDKYVDRFDKCIHIYQNRDRLYLETDYAKLGILELYRQLELYKEDPKRLFQYKADLAYAAQKVLEKNMFCIMNDLYRKTHKQKLCFGGGVALNSVLNGKIKKYTPFKEVFILPAANDAGTAIGSALYMYYNVLKQCRSSSTTQCRHNYGVVYTNEQIEEALRSYPVSYETVDAAAAAAEAIDRGHVIGWFQDGSEFGPRALGNRSILADPRNGKMKDYINGKIKFREDFRPFAPAVLEEHQQEYFISDFPKNPYMLFVAQVRPEKREIIPAVTHVDGSARVQIVSEDGQKKFHDLISCFYDRTGIPVVLNTSFNIKGKPIVETVHDAVRCFMDSNLDDLFINHYHIVKERKNKPDAEL